MRTLILGSRGSQLAVYQANLIAQKLREMNLTIEIQRIKTQGDKILDVPLAQIGGKGLFTKELEEALLDRRIDLAVHSLKDLPTELPHGLCIGAVLEREDVRDVLISRQNQPLDQLPRTARIGTSSLRRQAQLRHYCPGFQLVSLRGNLDTRLRKLETENLDAIVVAAAGVLRLGLSRQITQFLPLEISLPAVGQGALAVEIREDDAELKSYLARLDHPSTRQAVSAERSFLHRLEGGCQVPLGAYARVENARLTLEGVVSKTDGSLLLRDTALGEAEQAEAIGIQLAESLIQQGADKILREI